MYDLVEFGEWVGEMPRGWVEVGLGGVGGGGGNGEGRGGEGEEEGGVLSAMVVQVRVCENHQNGKDTHVRGVQIFARDERARVKGKGGKKEEEEEEEEEEGGKVDGVGGKLAGLEEPDWMGEPELR